MAYVAPTTRSDGYVVPASVWNQDVCANPIALAKAVSMLCNGRLTLTSGTPVTTADVTAAGTLYFTPYQGNIVGVYTGSAWVPHTLTELSIAAPAVANQVYDVFLDYNSGTPALSLTAWTNDTTRATALTTQDGVYVLTGTTTKRYLGTVRTVTASQLNDSFARRHVWNYYNRVTRAMRVLEATASWTYSTASYQQANASTANQLDFVVGVSEDGIRAQVAVDVYSGAAVNVLVSIGLDSTTTAATGATMGRLVTSAGSIPTPIHAFIDTIPAAGRHTLVWLEQGGGAGTQTWEGTNGGGQAGITGSWRA